MSWTGPRPDPCWGVFETLAVRDGATQALERHLDRLGGAVRDLYGERLSRDLASRARLTARRLQGVHRMRIIARPQPRGLAVRIETEPHSEPERQSPITLAPMALRGGLGRHKWCDRRLLDSLSARPSTPLIVDDDVGVLEAAWANFWIVEDGGIVTPAADGRLLPGVTRSLVLEAAPALGVATAIEPVSLARAREADAVFLTSSLRYAVSAEIDGDRSPQRHSPVVDVLRAALGATGWDR